MKQNKLKLLSIILILIFTSCYTVKKMNTQVTRGYLTYKTEFTDLVDNLLPPESHDSTNVQYKYIKGDTITKVITKQADCDTVKPNLDGKKIVYIEGKESIRIDTFYRDSSHYKTVLDTRRSDVLTAQNKVLNESLIASKTTLKFYKGGFFIILGIITLYILYRSSIFSKILSKFK